MDSQLKRFLASLYKINIEQYLITDNFKLVCLENDIDELWNRIDDIVHQNSNVAVLLPGFTGYAEQALPIFLENICRKKDFLLILNNILEGFLQWKKEKVDLTEVHSRLEGLGYSLNEIDKMSVFSRNKIIEKKQPIKFAKLFSKKNDKKTKTEEMCFVLMPFKEKFNLIYSSVIKPTVEKSKLNCLRADDIFNNKPIIEDIFEHIKKAKVIVADLSTKNPNVFYEVGLSHALSKEVILIAQDIEDIPFDLQHYRCIIYEDSVAGGKKLEEGLAKTLEEVLKRV